MQILNIDSFTMLAVIIIVFLIIKKIILLFTNLFKFSIKFSNFLIRSIWIITIIYTFSHFILFPFAGIDIRKPFIYISSKSIVYIRVQTCSYTGEWCPDIEVEKALDIQNLEKRLLTLEELKIKYSPYRSEKIFYGDLFVKIDTGISDTLDLIKIQEEQIQREKRIEAEKFKRNSVQTLIERDKRTKAARMRAIAIDILNFENALFTNSISAFREYIKTSSGLFVNFAKTLIEELHAKEQRKLLKQEEYRVYQTAKKKKSITSLESYLETCSICEYESSANHDIQFLKQNKKPETRKRDKQLKRENSRNQSKQPTNTEEQKQTKINTQRRRTRFTRPRSKKSSDTLFECLKRNNFDDTKCKKIFTQ